MFRLDEHGQVSAASAALLNMLPSAYKADILLLLLCRQWRKHWFVLCDTRLRFYRDSEAEEVRLDVTFPL